MIEALEEHLKATRYYYDVPDSKQRVVLEVLTNGHCHVWREGLIEATWKVGFNPNRGEKPRYCFDVLDEAIAKATELWNDIRKRVEQQHAH